MKFEMFKLPAWLKRMRRPAIVRREFVNPPREWTVAVSIGAVLLIVGAVWAGLFFFDTSQYIENGYLPPPNSSTSFSTERLGQVLSTYRDRQKKFEMLQNKTPLAPSIINTEVGSSTIASTTVAGDGVE